MKLSIKRTFCALLLGLASTGAAARCASMCGGYCSSNWCQVILCDTETGAVCSIVWYERPVQPF